MRQQDHRAWLFAEDHFHLFPPTPMAVKFANAHWLHVLRMAEKEKGEIFPIFPINDLRFI